jgi:penicillin-binding protein 1A
MAEDEAPVGIQEVTAGHEPLQDGARHDTNRVETKRILPADVAATETSILETVLQYGTGRAAAIGQFAAGKTGTTSNYGDAWFVGWDSKYTVAIWVGYPNKLIPMTTAFNGKPVLGGTFPALIWHSFMTSALQIEKERAEHIAEGAAGPNNSSGTTTNGAPTETSSTSSTSTGPSQGTKPTKKSTTPGGGSGEAGAGTPTPEHSAAPTPSPAPARETPSTPPSTPAAPPTTSPSPTGGVSPGG